MQIIVSKSHYSYFVLVCILAAASGCTTVNPQHNLPANAQAEINRAESLGRAIYEQDIAAARATDELVRQGLGRPQGEVHGWITLPAEDAWVVRFITEDKDAYAALYDVRISKEGRPTLTKLSPKERLSGGQEAMFRARQTALAATAKKCSDAYNTVVLADPDSAGGWLVYVLAATKTPQEIVVGGHHRVRVSSDGRHVIEDRPLSKSCVRIPPPDWKASEKAVASFTTHLISSTPIETHVFVSLQHGRPIYVATTLGTWYVNEGRIIYLRE